MDLDAGFPVLGYGGPDFEGAVKARSRGQCEWCGKEKATLIVAKRRVRNSLYEPSDVLHLCQGCARKHVAQPPEHLPRQRRAESVRMFEDRFYVRNR